MSSDPRDPRTFFAPRAEAYRASATHANPADLDRMVALLSTRGGARAPTPLTGARALDVATGGGHTANALAAAGCRVVATDVTREMLALAEARARRASVMADAQRLPFRDGAFEIVASRIAPHHFADLDAFARESARVLAPRGALYVFDLTTPDARGVADTIDHIERLRDPSHVSSWSPARWRTALTAAGFRVEQTGTSTSQMQLDPWIQRAEMPAAREAELRALLARHTPKSLGGYGLVAPGTMRVLRVEILARKENR
ncbi:MAG: class I SAM-dependent methyltransferase [Thermoplasmatota archaeon]